jgi:hypothetical protein
LFGKGCFFSFHIPGEADCGCWDLFSEDSGHPPSAKIYVVDFCEQRQSARVHWTHWAGIRPPNVVREEDTLAEPPPPQVCTILLYEDKQSLRLKELSSSDTRRASVGLNEREGEAAKRNS